jgi:hypothetical protein
LTPRTGRVLCWLSYFYFGGMALRYAVTMVMYPERRWLGHTVPIFVHFALAGFLFTLGHYHRSARWQCEVSRRRAEREES